MTLKCIVIGPQRELAAYLTGALQEVGGITVMKDLAQYPHEYELLRVVRSTGAQVVFLGLADLERSFEVLRALQDEFAGLQIVAFHDALEASMLMKLMQNGIREYLPSQFELRELAEILIRVRDAAEKNPMMSSETNCVYSFLPSKPGSGTTTLAVNAAVAMSRQPEGNCLLLDLDLNSGLVRFLLRLKNDRTILDAAAHAAEMDEALWSNLVSSIGRMDVLHAGMIQPGVRLEDTAIRDLIDYARKNYKAICVDLSGNMEKYAIEVMKESKKIFIVCTPEIPSLHLAMEKFRYLQAIELDDRVSFLLNRQSKNDVLQMSFIEKLLEAKVMMNFPNDYRGVNQAMTLGKEIDAGTELGKRINKLAYALLERSMPESQEKAKKQSQGLSELFGFGSGRLATVSDGESKG